MTLLFFPPSTDVCPLVGSSGILPPPPPIPPPALSPIDLRQSFDAALQIAIDELVHEMGLVPSFSQKSGSPK